MEQDALKVLEEARMFESLEKNPGWKLILEKLNDMAADSNAKLRNVNVTDSNAVVKAHMDWLAINDVRDTLFQYIRETYEVAAQITATQKEENIQ